MTKTLSSHHKSRLTMTKIEETYAVRHFKLHPFAFKSSSIHSFSRNEPRQSSLGHNSLALQCLTKYDKTTARKSYQVDYSTCVWWQLAIRQSNSETISTHERVQSVKSRKQHSTQKAIRVIEQDTPCELSKSSYQNGRRAHFILITVLRLFSLSQNS